MTQEATPATRKYISTAALTPEGTRMRLTSAWTEPSSQPGTTKLLYIGNFPRSEVSGQILDLAVRHAQEAGHDRLIVHAPPSQVGLRQALIERETRNRVTRQGDNFTIEVNTLGQQTEQ